MTSNEQLRAALTELLTRCREVKAALDATVPDGEPVHPQSAALTWPMSSAVLALESSDETTGDDGYWAAFYQIAELLGIAAMPVSPKQAFKTAMLPRLRALVTCEQALIEIAEVCERDTGLLDRIREIQRIVNRSLDSPVKTTTGPAGGEPA